MSPARAAVICPGAGLLWSGARPIARHTAADHMIRTIRFGVLAPAGRREPL
jgi:hypothetical protein